MVDHVKIWSCVLDLVEDMVIRGREDLKEIVVKEVLKVYRDPMVLQV